MEIFIKFIDDEAFAIHDVCNFYITDEGFWRILVNDGREFFFNKDQVKYIGDKSICFY